MTVYHYATIEKPEETLKVDKLAGIDMENLDYKRQPNVRILSDHIGSHDGNVLGMWHGGMFGLATNQVSVLSAWENADAASHCFGELAKSSKLKLVHQDVFRATVRPDQPERIHRSGIYVIRWIRMFTCDIREYTSLCLETWPEFEAAGTARCYGVFRPVEDANVSKLLMLTWYATLTDWELTRKLAPADTAKWARRSEMELSHWADVGRLLEF